MMFFIQDSPPIYWIAGHDFGTQVTHALADETLRNRFFNVQGPEAVTFRGAVIRFLRAYDPTIPMRKVPLSFVKFAGLFSIRMREFSRLFEHTQTVGIPFRSEATWRDLGKPTMKIEDYVEYMQATADIPTLG